MDSNHLGGLQPTNIPKSVYLELAARLLTCNCCIDIVTIRKQPERLVAQVRMTHATLLRSRMNGNVHVRFCSRVEVATPRLRQRPEGEGRETVQRYPANAQSCPWGMHRGAGEMDLSYNIPLS